MKKTIFKLIVFGAVFVLTLIVVSRIMNKGHDNLTMEMAQATLPLVTMEWEGIPYNELHGYTKAVNVAFQRDTVTVLNESRETGFAVDTCGENVTGISIEVRSEDGQRLIENTKITDYRAADGRIEGKIALKDLIEKGREYSLAIMLELDEGRTVSYYTRVIWSEKFFVGEKLEYVKDFHQRLYDKEAARELTKYLETNPRLEDNVSFHNVNIHSSFRQITWDELDVTEVSEPVIFLTDIASQTASVLMDYIVSTSEGKKTTYYMVEEHYRIRYTSDRVYLLDYQRNMTQIPDKDELYGNDKILLGITAPDVSMVESEDGNVVVFEVAGRLFSYDASQNQFAMIFSFYDEDNADARTLYRHHGIKILDVEEGGNVQFAVYGYMNRGRHEGEVGLQLYTYNNSLNTVEELIYISYDKTYSLLMAEMEELLYLNRDQQLYFLLDNSVYKVDLEKKTVMRLLEITQDGSLQISDNHKIAVWAEGRDGRQGSVLNIRNLSSDTQYMISVGSDEIIRPLGFMEEDVIYGVAYRETVVRDSSGRSIFPMYKVCICDASGELLKEYEQPGIYITECTVANNQITLERIERLESGNFRELEPDHIMNSLEAASGKNVIVTADIDRYKRYVEIQTRKNIDSKTVKILTPKEVVYEGGRVLELPVSKPEARYYVYGAYGVDSVYIAPAEAVKLAYSLSGFVMDESGECIWRRGNRVARNQIMAIKQPEKTEVEGSLALCLDTIFQFEGQPRNSEYLLEQGKTAQQILRENLEGYRVLDLAGCSLDAMLHYVNRDIPVLAILKDRETVLVTGFNETQVVIFEPSSGRLYRRSMGEAGEWFEENGNCFIVCLKK